MSLESSCLNTLQCLSGHLRTALPRCSSFLAQIRTKYSGVPTYSELSRMPASSTTFFISSKALFNCSSAAGSDADLSVCFILDCLQVSPREFNRTRLHSRKLGGQQTTAVGSV